MSSSLVIYSPQDQDGERHHDPDMGRFARSSLGPRPHIDILLDSPFLTLKGTGPDVEPTRLSGNVVLYLTEATDIKEITLQFRGKARLHVPATDTSLVNTASLAYVVCNHSWSFLEGARHTRTLKSGRHMFPFHLEIGGSLPASIATPVLGGPSVAYKLRALAIRPLLAQNLQAAITVPLIRSFTPEALEYQQTFEIENTWARKVMYSIDLPHKAWAIGDKLAVLVKFSPLTKGVSVESIVTNVVETTRVYARSGHIEDTRVVASSRHDFIEGRPVLIEVNKPWLVIKQRSSLTTPSRTPRQGSSSSSPTSPHSALPPARPAASHSPTSHFSTLPATSTSALPQSNAASSSFPQEALPSDNPPTSSHEDTVSGDIVATLFLPLSDTGIVPSHSIEPIIIQHRIRWSIYIRNPDMHISELRCSLPVAILHKQLLKEARSYTRLSRRIVLAPGLLDTGSVNELGVDDLEELDDIEERELPSYTAHVRDRVANMYLPETHTMRITNPWVVHAILPTPSFTRTTTGMIGLGEEIPNPSLNTSDATNLTAQAPCDGQMSPLNHSSSALPSPARGSTSISHASPSGQIRSATSRPTSGYTTPLHTASHVMSHLPYVPGSGESTPLDWINSELMMSLDEDPRRRSGPCLPSGGTQGSSRAHSRTASPERGRLPSRPMSPSEDGEGLGHGHGHNRKGLGKFLKGAMKNLGFTKHHRGSQSSSPHPPGSTSGPTSRTSSPFRRRHSRAASSLQESGPGTPVFGTFPALPLSSASNNNGDALLHRAFTEVPDYSIASKGFIGGVPPLSSMQGLPSYEECERESVRESRAMRPLSPLNSASQQNIARGVNTTQDGSFGKALGEGEETRRVVSDGDLVRRFNRVGLGIRSTMNSVREQTGRASSRDSSEEEDGIGIEVKSRGDVSLGTGA